MARRRDLEGQWAVRWAPIVGAVALLAYTGAGGERTDVVAHLTGFLSGAVLGVLYGGIERGFVMTARVQLSLGLAGLWMLALAWGVALSRG